MVVILRHQLNVLRRGLPSRARLTVIGAVARGVIELAGHAVAGHAVSLDVAQVKARPVESLPAILTMRALTTTRRARKAA